MPHNPPQQACLSNKDDFHKRKILSFSKGLKTEMAKERCDDLRKRDVCSSCVDKTFKALSLGQNFPTLPFRHFILSTYHPVDISEKIKKLKSSHSILTGCFSYQVGSEGQAEDQSGTEHCRKLVSFTLSGERTHAVVWCGEISDWIDG